MKNGITDTTKRTNSLLSDKYKIEHGDLLFSWSGSPDTSIDTFIWILGSAWLNQHIFTVKPTGVASKPYLYAMLKVFKTEFIEIARNKQTTGLGHVTRKDLERLKIVHGSSATMKAFDSLVSPAFERIIKSLEQNEVLLSLREAILSEFVAGRINIKNTEKRIAAA